VPAYPDIPVVPASPVEEAFAEEEPAFRMASLPLEWFTLETPLLIWQEVRSEEAAAMKRARILMACRETGEQRFLFIREFRKW
jgi:hypothetical protein